MFADFCIFIVLTAFMINGGYRGGGGEGYAPPPMKSKYAALALFLINTPCWIVFIFNLVIIIRYSL